MRWHSKALWPRLGNSSMTALAMNRSALCCAAIQSFHPMADALTVACGFNPL